jgi:beta-lactam-binding protein with PASTA domain
LIVTVALATAALAQVSSPKSISIPGLSGLTYDQAAQAAKTAGLTVTRGKDQASPDPKGTVISQSPQPGSFSGSKKVTLVVSSGPANVAVPNINKLPWAAAKEALQTAGLIFQDPPPSFPSEVVPKGYVLSVDPPSGRSVAPDTTVKIVLSSGHAPVPVPDIKGKSFADAVTALQGAHFLVRRAPKDEFSSTVDRGDVTRTEPAIGASAPYGSTIVVHISKGPDLVRVPDLFGLTFREASDLLDQFGFSTDTGSGGFKPHDRVQSQSPEADTMAPRNSTVSISH